jgi:hypothetical protein
MGAKHVCFACRKAFNVPYAALGPKHCPECQAEVVVLPHRFRPPKKRDTDKWAAAKYLVDHGFYFQHLSPTYLPTWTVGGYGNYIRYPENLREAKEFVEAYQTHAKKQGTVA